MPINFGTFDVHVGHFAAYFYMHTHALSPAPPTPPNGGEVSDEEWEAFGKAMIEFQSVREPVDVAAHHAMTRQFLEGLSELVSELQLLRLEEWTEENIQTEFYDAAKNTFGDEKASIREFFKMLYMVIFQTQSGPRWGQFLVIVGLDRFIEIIKERSETLPALKINS